MSTGWLSSMKPDTGQNTLTPSSKKNLKYSGPQPSLPKCCTLTIRMSCSGTSNPWHSWTSPSTKVSILHFSKVSQYWSMLVMVHDDPVLVYTVTMRLPSEPMSESSAQEVFV